MWCTLGRLRFLQLSARWENRKKSKLRLKAFFQFGYVRQAVRYPNLGLKGQVRAVDGSQELLAYKP